MTAEHHRPLEVTVQRAAHLLSIRFEDGQHFDLPTEYLRVYSPSAEVQGHHGVGGVLQVGKEEVNIKEVRQIGHYALKIFFDDGHRHGLFTWDYLYDLGQRFDELWADYLARLEQSGHVRHKTPRETQHRKGT